MLETEKQIETITYSYLYTYIQGRNWWHLFSEHTGREGSIEGLRSYVEDYAVEYARDNDGNPMALVNCLMKDLDYLSEVTTDDDERTL